MVFGKTKTLTEEQLIARRHAADVYLDNDLDAVYNNSNNEKFNAFEYKATIGLDNKLKYTKTEWNDIEKQSQILFQRLEESGFYEKRESDKMQKSTYPTSNSEKSSTNIKYTLESTITPLIGRIKDIKDDFILNQSKPKDSKFQDIDNYFSKLINEMNTRFYHKERSWHPTAESLDNSTKTELKKYKIGANPNNISDEKNILELQKAFHILESNIKSKYANRAYGADEELKSYLKELKKYEVFIKEKIITPIDIQNKQIITENRSLDTIYAEYINNRNTKRAKAGVILSLLAGAGLGAAYLLKNKDTVDITEINTNITDNPNEITNGVYIENFNEDEKAVLTDIFESFGNLTLRIGEDKLTVTPANLTSLMNVMGDTDKTYTNYDLTHKLNLTLEDHYTLKSIYLQDNPENGLIGQLIEIVPTTSDESNNDFNTFIENTTLKDALTDTFIGVPQFGQLSGEQFEKLTKLQIKDNNGKLPTSLLTLHLESDTVAYFKRGLNGNIYIFAGYEPDKNYADIPQSAMGQAEGLEEMFDNLFNNGGSGSSSSSSSTSTGGGGRNGGGETK